MPKFPKKYIEAGNVLYNNRKKPFVERILMGNRQPVYNTIDNQTHLMSTVDNYAMPLLQYKDGVWTNLVGSTPRELFDESMKTDNFIEFNSPEEAEAWSKDYHVVMDNPEIIKRVMANKKAFSKYLKS